MADLTLLPLVPEVRTWVYEQPKSAGVVICTDRLTTHRTKDSSKYEFPQRSKDDFLKGVLIASDCGPCDNCPNCL